jgi:hypothetical protein
MKFKYELSILVVLYNKTIRESETINSILKYEELFPKATKFVIWNNGPKYIKEKEFHSKNKLDVDFKETISNIPLSKIYNDFIKSHDAGKYIILDHDSKLSKEYIEDILLSKTIELILPIIRQGTIIQSPIFNNNKIPSLNNINDINDIKEAIGSGLCISKNLSDMITVQNGNVFDERFYLYGVDTSFFRRLHKLKISDFKITIKLASGFTHSLSRLESESEDVIHFRMLERSYDQALQLRYYEDSYNLLKFYKRIIRIIKNRVIKREKDIFIFHFIKGYITGRHYKL